MLGIRNLMGQLWIMELVSLQCNGKIAKPVHDKRRFTTLEITQSELSNFH